jgi:diguanylate cyclase (GGDEF)-like protein
MTSSDGSTGVTSSPADEEPVDPTRPARFGPLRLWVFSASLLVAALILFGVSAPSGQLIETPLPWWGLLVMFFAAEFAVVHLYFARDSHATFSFSFSEVPLAVGILLADPLLVLGGRVIGGAAALWTQGHRQPVKFAFNVSSFALEAVTAILLYRALIGDASPMSGRGWMTLFAALGVASAVSALAVPAAISIAEKAWMFSQMSRVLGTAMMAGVTNTGLGLLAVVVYLAEPRAVWLLALVAGLLVVAYRGYSTMRQKHESLSLLHGFTQRVGLSLEDGRTSETLLQQAIDLLRAECAEISLLSEDEHLPSIVTSLRSGSELPCVDHVPHGPTSLHRQVAQRGDPVLIRRGTTRPDQVDLLRQHAVRDAVVVPLRHENGVFGTLLIGGRLGEVGGFDMDDVRLCQTIANHASVLLENGRLVERLREEAAEKEHQALHDALTGLPNRTLFQIQTQQAVAEAARSGRKVAVMLLDLDRFKEVNDTLGHHIGDDLLQTVAARLRHLLPTEDVVARLGGDEFGILLTDARDEDVAERVAERVRSALEQPFVIGSLTLVVGASLGIVLAPDHGDQATTLLQRADVAMYAAKEQHRGVVVYTSQADQHSPRRLALVGELRKALEQSQIEVHYQPKADVRTGEIVGVEALVRWLHAELGSISPEEFVPIAERTGMIHPLTTYVLRTALSQCREWRRSGIKLDVAVNVSSGSLLNIDFPAEVRRLLDEAGVAPRALTLEVTEGSIMADPQRCIHVLTALSGMGVQLAVDDFGTGYSSLSQLKQLPVDELKIDKSFIVDMTSDDDDATIVRSTIDLGHNLGLRVVAEGVEDRTTWQAVGALGCDVVQGFYLSRALTATSLTRWLSDWQRGVETRVLPPVDERARGLALGVPDHPGSLT